jgi:hypothetical protein
VERQADPLWKLFAKKATHKRNVDLNLVDVHPRHQLLDRDYR